MDFLQTVAAFVAVVGGLKALEYLYEKMVNQHDKSQKIDENSVTLEEYIKKNDARVSELEKSVSVGHRKAFEVMDEMKDLIAEATKESTKECVDLIKEHRDEYMKRIESVEKSITEMSAIYQQTVAVVDVKIDNLADKVEKHNKIVERTYECEAKLKVHDEQFRVTNARLKKLDGNRYSTDDDGK